MRRDETFTLRVNASESKMLARLAKHHHRSRSDVVRVLIIEAIQTIAEVAKTIEDKSNVTASTEEPYDQSIVKS